MDNMGGCFRNVSDFSRKNGQVCVLTNKIKNRRLSSRDDQHFFYNLQNDHLSTAKLRGFSRLYSQNSRFSQIESRDTRALEIPSGCFRSETFSKIRAGGCSISTQIKHRGYVRKDGQGGIVAKRFTDTDKWKREWFSELSPKAKLVWFYMLDQCDHRGVWFANFKLASSQVGFKITKSDFEKWFGSKVMFFDKDKYFIPSFVEFQYGVLNAGNNAHKAIIQLMEKLAPQEVLMRTSQRAQDKDKDKDKEEDKDKDKEEEFLDFEILYAAYPNKVNKGEGISRLRDQIKTRSQFNDFLTAVHNYCRYLKLPKNSNWLNAKNFDVFIGPKTKEEKPWQQWVNPDPSIFTEGEKPKRDYSFLKDKTQ